MNLKFDSGSTNNLYEQQKRIFQNSIRKWVKKDKNEYGMGKYEKNHLARTVMTEIW